jgi:hypothetical protein
MVELRSVEKDLSIVFAILVRHHSIQDGYSALSRAGSTPTNFEGFNSAVEPTEIWLT